MQRVILVAGATGALGKQIVAALRARGESVRLLVRDEARARVAFPNESLVEGRALDAASLRGACDGVDAVVSALGASTFPFPWKGWRSFDRIDVPAHRNLVAEAKRAGVRRFVYVSAFSTPEIARTPYVRAHDRVTELLAESGLSHCTVKPTGLFSAFDLFRSMALRGRVMCIGDGRAKSNPVADDDVARACVDVLDGGETERAIGGPDVLTRREMSELAFAGLGRKVRVTHVPAALVRFGGLVARPFLPRVGDLLAFFAAIGERDLVAPATGTRRLADHFVAGRG